jgi:hypothetical protein
MQGRSRLAHWLGRVLAGAALLVAGVVYAQQAAVPVRPIHIAWLPVPSLSFGARDFVDAEVVKKLQSGLPQNLITRMYAYSETGREPIALAGLSCRVVYDLWDGVYRIERATESADRTVSVRNLDGVLQQCLDVQNAVIGDATSFIRQRGRYVYFGVVVELNPLSPDTIQRIRRWLARPSGSELNGNAFFGSFVSIFVGRKLGAADKTLSFRSELFAVPP